MTDGIVQTRSGVAFDILNPKPEMVVLDDIAWALAHIARFNGHASRFYSVAEHSALGAIHLASAHGLSMQRGFLLHDAAEAYIGDICRPVKKVLGPAVVAIEAEIQRVIEDRFGIGLVPGQTLKDLDNMMVMLEADQLMARPLVGQWPDGQDLPAIRLAFGGTPQSAYALFLATAALLGVS